MIRNAMIQFTECYMHASNLYVLSLSECANLTLANFELSDRASLVIKEIKQHI